MIYKNWDCKKQFSSAVAVVELFKALDIPPCKYTEEGYRPQDLLRLDVVRHKSKYLEEMKSDLRP